MECQVGVGRESMEGSGLAEGVSKARRISLQRGGLARGVKSQTGQGKCPAPEEKSVHAWSGLAWDVKAQAGKGACVAMACCKVQPQEDERGVYTER